MFMEFRAGTGELSMKICVRRGCFVWQAEEVVSLQRSEPERQGQRPVSNGPWRNAA